MGIRLFGSNSSSSFDWNKGRDKPLPNPDPNNYIILRSLELWGYLLIEIKYLDCTNYEGNKILLFRDCSLEDLKKQKHIDPHFCENKNFYSPIVRFEPTVNGWKMGLDLIYLNRRS